MKKNWHLFGIGFSMLLSTVIWHQTVSAPNEKLTSLAVELSRVSPQQLLGKNPKESLLRKNSISTVYKTQKNLADSVISMGLKRIGTPYITAGFSEAGFDCSGFVSYIFKKVGIEVPHSSRMLAETGKFVNREEAQRGDIVIFTGTDLNNRTPGHVGIVVNNVGQKVSFVHSSSNGGVKISEIENSNYEKRFLEIRRVL